MSGIIRRSHYKQCLVRADKEWIRNRGLVRGSQQSELLYRVRLAESDFSPGNCEELDDRQSVLKLFTPQRTKLC